MSDIAQTKASGTTPRSSRAGISVCSPNLDERLRRMTSDGNLSDEDDAVFTLPAETFHAPMREPTLLCGWRNGGR